ncbi:MAG: tetratricopeptide repeat protein [Pseudomonadota bacterium]
MSAAFVGLAACVSAPADESVVGDYLSARFAAHTNDVYGAASSFSKARQQAPGSVEIRRTAFFFDLAAGKYDEAMAIAEVMAKDPNAGDGGFAKGALAAKALKAGDYARAIRIVSAAREDGFPAPAANLIEVWAIAGKDGDDTALTKLRGIPGEEYRGFYPLHAALLAENLQRPDEARSAYQLSVMAFSGSAEIDAYGEFLERQGDDKSIRDYYELLASQDGLGRFAGRTGLARLDAGRIRTGSRTVSPSEGATLALYSLASGILQDAYERRQAAERAGFRVGEADYNLPLAMTRLALYLDPDLDDAQRFAGSILNLYGDHEQAIALLSMVEPDTPYYEQARIEIAGAYAAQERTDEAIAALRTLIRRQPNARDARLSLAGLYASQDRHADTVAVMNSVIETLPPQPQTTAWRYYLTRAASLLEINEWKRAEADLVRAVEIAPEEATALNYLGYSWAERGENLEKAFDLIEKAVAIEPNSGAIIDSLGWAHYQLGNYTEAVGYLEQAASIEPGDPTITDHLGDVYWRLDRPIEARYQWRRVLELEPDEELTNQINEKLEDGLTSEANEASAAATSK